MDTEGIERDSEVRSGVTRHRLETAFVLALLLLVFGAALLAEDAAADPSARATLVVAFVGISGWVVYRT